LAKAEGLGAAVNTDWFVDDGIWASGNSTRHAAGVDAVLADY
jgi:hypothetical protein